MKRHTKSHVNGNSKTMRTSEWPRVLQNRYEWLHIANDFSQAACFIVGSIFFFYGSLHHIVTWLFLIGSVQMLISPIIRTGHKLHLKNVFSHSIHF